MQAQKYAICCLHETHRSPEIWGGKGTIEDMIAKAIRIEKRGPDQAEYARKWIAVCRVKSIGGRNPETGETVITPLIYIIGGPN